MRSTRYFRYAWFVACFTTAWNLPQGARADECRATLLAPFDGLVAGAVSQCVVLQGNFADCDGIANGAAIVVSSEAAPGARIGGSVRDTCVPQGSPQSAIGVELRDIPADLPDALLGFRMAVGEHVIPFEAQSLQRATFERVGAVYAQSLDMSHANGPVAAAEGGALRLVRDPLATESTPQNWGVHNAVSVSLPNTSSLPRASNGEPQRLYWCVQSQGVGYFLDRSRRPFGVRGNAVATMGPDARSLISDGVLRVVVPASDTGAVRAWIYGIVARETTALDRRAEDSLCRSGSVVADLGTLVVSSRLEEQSVPLEFRGLIALRCDHPVREIATIAGGALAPMTRHLDTCRICYSPSPRAEGRLCEEVREAATEGEDPPPIVQFDELLRRSRTSPPTLQSESDDFERRRRLAYHGPQTLRLELVDGEGDPIRAAANWTIAPASFANLPLELKGEDATEIYVRVTLNVAAQQATYASHLVEADADDGEEVATNTEFRFTAAIRPRGTFGIAAPFRFFVTASVVPVGFRMPADANSLMRSSQPRGISLAPGVVSALFVVEPWNWRIRENPLLGLRLGAGLLLFEAGEDAFAPSFLAGMALSLPLFQQESSQLGTSLALWTFYERDLSERRNHALVTLSVDLLTLFSGNTGSSGAAASQD